MLGFTIRDPWAMAFCTEIANAISQDAERVTRLAVDSLYVHLAVLSLAETWPEHRCFSRIQELNFVFQ